MRTLPTDTMLATAMTIWKSKISRHYRDRGYQLFRGVFPRQEVETIAQAARLVSHFEDRLRRQNGQFEVNEFFPNTRLVRNTLLHPHLGLPEPLTPFHVLLELAVTDKGQAIAAFPGWARGCAGWTASATTSFTRSCCSSPRRARTFIWTAGRSTRRPSAARIRSGFRCRT